MYTIPVCRKNDKSQLNYVTQVTLISINSHTFKRNLYSTSINTMQSSYQIDEGKE